MSERSPVETRNLDIYGSAPLPWSRARDLFVDDTPGDSRRTFMGTTFLSTVRPDGRPHSAGIGALWVDGDIYFTSGPGARKSRNLAENPACTLSARLATIDVIFEGEAIRITDGPTLERVAERCREGGWPVQVEGAGFTAPYAAPSAGPPPWNLYRMTVHTAIGNATTEPHGATLWRFEV